MSDSISYQYRNLHTALYEFLTTYITPAIEPTQVLAGDQQNMVLPENEDYIIFTIVSQMRHGTTSENYDPDGETLSLHELNEVVVKVDCYADSTNSTQDDAILRAQIRANNLNTLFRSSVAPDFFKRYGISALYADDAQNTTLVSDSQQYLHRWTVNLHLCFKSSVVVPQPGFTKMGVKMNSIITAAEAEADPIAAGKLHVADVDVKIPN
jgi:hypothetical protein